MKITDLNKIVDLGDIINNRFNNFFNDFNKEVSKIGLLTDIIKGDF